MFKPIKGGSMQTVQGLNCWIPPVGCGTHCDTGELKKTDIIKRSRKDEDQYWEPQPLPDDYNDRFYLEQVAQISDPDYVDPELEKIRVREWHRRLYGVWVFMNGKPVYLTGLCYFFLNYWFLDSGLPDFRIVDLEYFYAWQYVVEDPKCYGLIETRKRRDGKTHRASCILYEYTSRNKRVWSGIQSMNKTVAGEIFTSFLVPSFKALPEFFVPTYDTSQGDAPKTQLRFFRTVKKGRVKLGDIKKLELQSKIDFKDHKPKAYDGKKLHRLLLDESGKVETDVIERHIILRPCLLDNKLDIVGKMLVTSTVEEMGLKFRYKELWMRSDQYRREKDGTTKSGLVKFFMGADRAGRYDKYGIPFTKDNYDEIINERGKENNQTDLIGLIRKFPLTEAEAFKSADVDCIYNWGKLSQQQDTISWKDGLVERGNFQWVDPYEINKGVVWAASKNGRFEICYALRESEANRILSVGSQFSPNNNHSFVMGCDPYKFRDVEDSRRSDCAAFVYQKFNVHNEAKAYNDAFVCKYKFRAPTPGMQYDDVLKMAVYYGCQVLFEINIGTAPIDYFSMKNCYHFCMKLPGEQDPGIYTDGQGRVTEQICALTETYIDENIDKVYFNELIDDWLTFTPGKTTKFDCAMAAGFTLIAAKRKFRVQDESRQNEVTNFMRQYKAS